MATGLRPPQAGLPFDLFPRCIPGGDSLIEIGVVGKMAANRGIVAELFIFDRAFTAPNCIEKVRLVIGEITVARRHGEGL